MAVHRSHVTIGTLSLTTLAAAIATTVTLAAPAPATVSMTPTTAVAGSPQTYVETFKASKALTNGVVTTTIPFGWTTPQTTSSGGPGFVSTAKGSCTSIVGPLTVSPGAGPWTISAAGITCPTGATFTLTYANAFTTIASKYTFSPTTAMATAVGTPTAITAPSVTVSPGAASILVLSGTQTATAGTAISVTVRAQDAPGNTATGYRGTIHFSSADVHATLPGDYTYKAGDNGSHTFSVTLNTAGLRAVTATDVATPSITGTLPGISVGAASASALQFTGPSSPTGAGVADLFTVTAVDSFGNTATGYLGTVHFTSTDPQASLPSSYPFSSTDAGAHQFSVTFRTLGSRTVTVTDNAKKPLTATTPGVTVTPGPATHFVVTGYPNPTVAGVSHSFTVTARDQFNNTATVYTGTVDITSTDGNAVLPAPYAFQATDAGARTFPATLKTAGSQSISVADAGDSAINGSQSGIVVQPATASALSVTGYPATTVGDTHDFTVTALDAFNNTVTGYAGTVEFTSSDSRAALPSDYTFVGADAGTHTFSASLLSTPSQSITATQVGSPSVTGTQAGIPVAAATLTITASDESMTYGDTTLPTVTPSYDGLINPPDSAPAQLPTCTAHPEADPPKTSCADASDPNYDISYVDGNLTVNPKQVTVTANDKTITYGDSDPTFDFTAPDVLAGDSPLAGVSCEVTAIHINAGSYPAAITCSGNSDPNYDVTTYVDGTLTIDPKPVTVTANNKTITFGDDLPTFDYSAPGVLPGDDLGVTCGVATAVTGPGSYDITCSDATNTNYDATINSGTLTVDAPSGTAPDAPTNVSATPGDGSATVSFTPPSNDGGSAITGYTVTASDSTTAIGLTSPILVTGLTNGTSYTFTVHATNNFGDSPESDASNAVTPTAQTTVSAGAMGSAHYHPLAVTLNNGRVMIVGGSQGFTPTAYADIYDPSTGTWHETPALKVARPAGATATLLADGRVLLAGGEDSAEDITATAEIYNPSTDTWTLTDPMPYPRYGHTATRLANGEVVIADGTDAQGQPTKTSALYDPNAGTWTDISDPSLPNPATTFDLRTDGQATLLNDGKVLLAGGSNAPDFPLSAVEHFDPALLSDPVNSIWNATGYMSTRRTAFAMIRLADGRVLAAGGYGSPTDNNLADLTSAEVYDPVTETWSSAGDMSSARDNFSAALRPDGTVVVAGGAMNFTSPFTEPTNIEIYNPLTNAWSPGGFMSGARDGAAIATLPDGSVLIAGGTGSVNSESTAEILPADTCGFGGTTDAGTCTYNTVGTDTFMVPAGVTSITVDAYGAQGGGAAGGLGGETQATLTVTPGEILQVNVGGQGGLGQFVGFNSVGGAGGFNGGGAGGCANTFGELVCTPNPGNGGGGASDIRDGAFGVGNRLVVAGGGGGSGVDEGGCASTPDGGSGGGASGAQGTSGCSDTADGGLGGSGGTGGLGATSSPGCGGPIAGHNGGVAVGGAGGGGTTAGGGGGGGGYGGGGGGYGYQCGGNHNGAGGGGGGGHGPNGSTLIAGVREGHGLVVIAFGP